MKYLLPSILVSFLLLFSACRKDDIDTTTTITPPTPSVKIQTDVHGIVRDENGDIVADAFVKMGDAEATTDAYGYFTLSSLQDSERALVSVNKPGYFTAYPAFNPNVGSQEFLEIQLIQRSLSGSLDATDGGTVSLSNGSAVEFGAASFVTPDGTPYTGTVQVFAHYLDPTDPELYQYMPGDLTAINTNGEMRGLVTYGMLNVELETTSGEELDINQKATITLPLPADLQSSAPESIPLWYYDEALGLWIEEGQATRSGDAYVGEVDHFTFWNCDVPFDFVTITGQVEVGGYTPHVQVKLTRLDNGDSASDYTDNKGLFDGKVPKDQIFLMEVINDCGTILYTEEIGPFSVDTYVGSFDVDLTDDFSLIFGTVVDCDMEPVINGLVSINGDGATYELAPTGLTGDFITLVATCQGDEVTVTAIDVAAQVEGDPVTVPVETDIDLGTLNACGNQITSGILMEFNGGELFIPYCTVTVENDPNSGNPQIYTFTSVWDEGSGNQVVTEYTIIDWNADPSNPIWAMAYNQELYGSVNENYVFVGGDITLEFADYNPGGVIQMVFTDCEVTEDISSTQYNNSTVTLTGIVQ